MANKEVVIAKFKYDLEIVNKNLVDATYHLNQCNKIFDVEKELTADEINELQDLISVMEDNFSGLCAAMTGVGQ